MQRQPLIFLPRLPLPKRRRTWFRLKRLLSGSLCSLESSRSALAFPFAVQQPFPAPPRLALHPIGTLFPLSLRLPLRSPLAHPIHRHHVPAEFRSESTCDDRQLGKLSLKILSGCMRLSAMTDISCSAHHRRDGNHAIFHHYNHLLVQSQAKLDHFGRKLINITSK